MQVFVLFFALFATEVYGGVGVLTPEIEAEALRLWQAHCEGASEGGTDGSTYIYCKKSQEKLEESLKHELSLKSADEQQDQIVFVQPPSYHYKHDVIVSGGGASGPKTVIYVKPAKNTHEVNIQDQTEKQEKPNKPTLYFLKGSHGGEATAEVAAAAAAAAADAPPAEAPPGYPASVDEGAAARRRRENGFGQRLALPQAQIVPPAASPQPNKAKTVYILRRT